MSAITRCARNLAQDGEIVPVRDDAYDALCLDGKRLVPLDVSIDPDPTDPYQAREYRTFPDTFSRIVGASLGAVERLTAHAGGALAREPSPREP